MCIIAALGHVESTAITRDVNETEMFYIEIRPELFNWTNGILVFDSNNLKPVPISISNGFTLYFPTI